MQSNNIAEIKKEDKKSKKKYIFIMLGILLLGFFGTQENDYFLLHKSGRLYFVGGT